MKEPIRKRAYYRALKRGETWAKIRKASFEMMNKLATDIYCTEGNAYIIGIEKKNET